MCVSYDMDFPWYHQFQLVTLTFDLILKNFIIGIKSFLLRDGDFIFGIHVLYDKDSSRGGNFRDISHISFIKPCRFYFRVVIFREEDNITKNAKITPMR